jgi:hypothetical protein
VGETPAVFSSLSLLCGFWPAPFTVTLIGTPFLFVNDNKHNNDYHLCLTALKYPWKFAMSIIVNSSSPLHRGRKSAA